MAKTPSFASVPELPQPSSFDHPIVNDDSLRSFTLFPKLPIELRLKIWRSTFPRNRSIDLHKWAMARTYKFLEEGEGLPAPVTLYVNSESRQETLKHYFILREKIGCSRPDFFNPTLDRVYIQAWKLYVYWYCLDAFMNSLQADGTGTDIFGRVESLEVQTEWDACAQEVKRTPLPSNGRLSRWAQLLGFTNLKRVLFVIEPALPDGNARQTVDEIMDRNQEIVGRFKSFFDLHKNRFQGGKAPLVTARMEEDPEDEAKI